MGTKNNPGPYDCYARAEPDEPMFILLGRDPLAPVLVETWAELRSKSGGPAGKVAEALDCASRMRAWLQRLGEPLLLSTVSIDYSTGRDTPTIRTTLGEAVNHPQHYGGDTTYEVIKVIEAWELDKNFCLGNTVKYVARAGKKGGALEDLKKARWYLDREISKLEKAGG